MDTQAIYQSLSSLFPPNQLIFDASKLSPFQTDKSPLLGELPVGVVEIHRSEEVGILLRWANQTGVSIVTRGAGTGTTGGALAAQSGTVILSTRHLNHVLDLDLQNRCITVQPGVINQEINNAAISHGLFYPPDPASLYICSIGGNLAENAGGPRALKYGVTGDYVLGLKGFFGNGQPFSFGGKRVKDVAGYDLKRLLIGSEGTIGVITEAILKLVPLPPFRSLMFIGFMSTQDSLKTLYEIQRLGIQPACAELIDWLSLKSVSEYLSLNEPIPTFEAAILFEIEAGSESELHRQMEQINWLCDRSAIAFCKSAISETDIEKLWSIRRNISHALRSASPDKCSEDVVVPVSQIPELMKLIRGLNSDQVEAIGFGHLGDGNIHVNFLRRTDSIEDWNITRNKARDILFQSVVKMGGSITAEHGVGQTKRNFLPLMFSAEILATFAQVKAVFDPNNILNPGIF